MADVGGVQHCTAVEPAYGVKYTQQQSLPACQPASSPAHSFPSLIGKAAHCAYLPTPPDDSKSSGAAVAAARQNSKPHPHELLVMLLLQSLSLRAAPVISNTRPAHIGKCLHIPRRRQGREKTVQCRGRQLMATAFFLIPIPSLILIIFS